MEGTDGDGGGGAGARPPWFRSGGTPQVSGLGAEPKGQGASGREPQHKRKRHSSLSLLIVTSQDLGVEWWPRKGQWPVTLGNEDIF